MRNLTDLLFLKRFDELQADVGVACTAVEGCPFLANALSHGILLGESGLSVLLPSHKISVSRSFGLFEFALRAREHLGQLGNFGLQVRLVALLSRQNLGLELLRL